MGNAYVGFASLGVAVGIGIGIDVWEEYSIPILTPIPINPDNGNFHASGIMTFDQGTPKNERLSH